MRVYNQYIRENDVLIEQRDTKFILCYRMWQSSFLFETTNNRIFRRPCLLIYS